MIEEIVEGLYLVHGASKGRFPWSHSILAVGDRTVLFDTGCGEKAIDEVKESYHVDLVVNSHTHPDHFSGNHHFRECELWVPDMFASILPDLENMSLRLTGGGEPAREWLHLVREVLGHVPTEPTGTFWEGDVIDLGDMRFRALYTPGHTLDHFCFLEEKRRIILSFDIDLTPFGPWYGHVECDLDQFCDSLHRVLALRPEMIVSSHRRPLSEGIEEEIAAFDDVFVRRNRKVLDLLGSGPATPEGLAGLSPFYGVPDSGFALARYFEARMIEKHLELLERRGLAEKQGDGSYRMVR
ncbi:MAG: MBL fold metallo-hydrolase [Actinobacteria bacterium]|jgi:glyoxylase-like metal-dependent hydrolase (beta-lactamase superfamily II)|nr:MAG: MBL fold metallo-hydrolase [Actinomycetota bacterium]